MTIIISINLTHRKKLDISLLVGQCLQDVHLIKKNNLIMIMAEEFKNLCQIFVKRVYNENNYLRKKRNDTANL